MRGINYGTCPLRFLLLLLLFNVGGVVSGNRYAGYLYSLPGIPSRKRNERIIGKNTILTIANTADYEPHIF